MREYSESKGNPNWQQDLRIDPVEINNAANSFRHHLAEVVFDQSKRQFSGAFVTIGSVADFGELFPKEERRSKFEMLQSTFEDYPDEVRDEWVSEPLYSPDEAHEISQSSRRYRLITFSNFLTNMCTVVKFKPNVMDLLQDAGPGTVLMVIGGIGRKYGDVNRFLDELAQPVGFDRIVSDETVTTRDSEVQESVYSERKSFYKHLQRLSPNSDWKTETVRKRFEQSPVTPPPSEVRVYRKYRY